MAYAWGIFAARSGHTQWQQLCITEVGGGGDGRGDRDWEPRALSRGPQGNFGRATL